MARFVLLRGSRPVNLSGSILTNLLRSILNTILIVAACVLASAWVQAPALAQHPGSPAGAAGHPSTGPRMGAPHSAPISRPGGAGPQGVGPRGVVTRGMGPRVPGPHMGGVGPRGVRFRLGAGNVFRSHIFFGAPIDRAGLGFRFGGSVLFNSAHWWPPTCAPSLGWAWGWGFNCYFAPYYGFGFENYVSVPMYENSVYLYGYGQEGRDLIWIYLKDGTVYEVTDYWVVNGQLHFSTIEDDPTKAVEHAIPYDELDVQKTSYVNTHRGFRMVLRDEPWPQYLKDHPDSTPPDMAPPEKK